MSRLSEFMARGVRQGDEQVRSPGRSTSRGLAVVLKGWSKGMDKAAVTLLLRDYGIPLAQAHDATNSILHDEPVSVRFPPEVNVEAVRCKLEQLGVVL
jgi:hypothetical protein